MAPETVPRMGYSRSGAMTDAANSRQVAPSENPAPASRLSGMTVQVIQAKAATETNPAVAAPAAYNESQVLEALGWIASKNIQLETFGFTPTQLESVLKGIEAGATGKTTGQHVVVAQSIRMGTHGLSHSRQA